MTRDIETHIVDGDNPKNQLTISVIDEPGAGGANHAYLIGNPPQAEGEGGQRFWYPVNFQNGPIQENGVNGVTQEALLAIVIDRLRSFQAGPCSSDYNAEALSCCEQAMSALQGRTRERIFRGVEGKNEK